MTKDIMILNFGNDEKSFIIKIKDIDKPYVIDYDDFVITISSKSLDSDKMLFNLLTALFKLISTCDCDTCDCDYNEKYANIITAVNKYNPNLISNFYRLITNYYESEIKDN